MSKTWPKTCEQFQCIYHDMWSFLNGFFGNDLYLHIVVFLWEMSFHGVEILWIRKHFLLSLLTQTLPEAGLTLSAHSVDDSYAMVHQCPQSTWMFRDGFLPENGLLLRVWLIASRIRGFHWRSTITFTCAFVLHLLAPPQSAWKLLQGPIRLHLFGGHFSSFLSNIFKRPKDNLKTMASSRGKE